MMVAFKYYPGIVDSKMYQKVTSLAFDGRAPQALKELQKVRVSYGTEEARTMGEYYLKLERMNAGREVTGQLLARRLPDLSELNDEIVDVNTFVAKCMEKGIQASDLPPL